MTTAFATPRLRVDIVQGKGKNKNKLEACHPTTGEVLGSAERRFGRGEEDWVGWFVQVGALRQVVGTKAEARELLETLAGAVA